MRLSADKANYLETLIKSIVPNAHVFLFGSRINDTAKGGDIDICILSEGKIPVYKILQIRIAFFKTYGFQKLDLVNFTTNDNSVFKQIILSDAVKLGE